MDKRAQLNQQFYQQAVTFAENFAEPTKSEYLAELQARQAFEQAEQHKRPLQKISGKRPLVFAILAMIAIVAVSYWQSQRYQQVEQGLQAFEQFQQQTTTENPHERNDHYIISLQNQLRENSNNGELWFELGQAYSLNNDFDSALICFHNAETLLGTTAAILGAKATADYYQHHQRLSPQALAWIKQALAQDPKESASLLLLASEAFLQHRFAEAIGYWEQALEAENPALDRRAIIQSIKTAEQMAQTQ